MVDNESKLMAVDPEAGIDRRLADERTRQIKLYVDHGFSEALGLTPEAYAASFPDVPQLPEDYDGDLDRLVYVDNTLGYYGLRHRLTEKELVANPVFWDDKRDEANGKSSGESGIGDSLLDDSPERIYPVWVRISENGMEEPAQGTRFATASEVVAFGTMYPQLSPPDKALAAPGSELQRRTSERNVWGVPVFRFNNKGWNVQRLGAEVKETEVVAVCVRK